MPYGRDYPEDWDSYAVSAQSAQTPDNADTAYFAETPTPLDRVASLPNFPTAALPLVIAKMVRSVAESTQTDPGMAGTIALGALSAAAAGYVEVEPRPNYREPVQLWTLPIALPGERKSSVCEAMVGPLRNVERELAAAVEVDINQQRVRRDVAERAAEKARKDAGNTDGADRADKLSAAMAAAAEVEGIDVPAVPRIIADDVTPEAMTSLVAEQKGALAIVSAEGGIFATLAGRYDAHADLSPWLKAHAGDAIRVDRKGRAAEFIQRPALTMAVMIQPGILAAASQNKAFHDSGLLARFLYSWPTSLVGRRNVDPAPLADDVRAAYAGALSKLAHRMRANSELLVLTLSPSADQARLDFARMIESRLAEGADLAHIRSWASKIVGAAIRIAGLLHVTKSEASEIAQSEMANAIILAEYFIGHALRVFDGMANGNDDRELARRILDLIGRKGEGQFSTFTERQLITAASRSWMPDRETAQRGLQILNDFGWIEQLPTEDRTGQRGRKPSPGYRVHPNAFQPPPPSAISAEYAQPAGDAA
jgi:replicative DNA helicase